ncbi:hypothetical protein C8R45DRAFT_1206858 [Mycena sanguinolenta]|nr:hypothetical protein C8R45DRAFT_1206858 [Mycena sanguinolenta]
MSRLLNDKDPKDYPPFTLTLCISALIRSPHTLLTISQSILTQRTYVPTSTPTCTISLRQSLTDDVHPLRSSLGRCSPAPLSEKPRLNEAKYARSTREVGSLPSHGLPHGLELLNSRLVSLVIFGSQSSQYSVSVSFCFAGSPILKQFSVAHIIWAIGSRLRTRLGSCSATDAWPMACLPYTSPPSLPPLKATAATDAGSMAGVPCRRQYRLLSFSARLLLHDFNLPHTAFLSPPLDLAP